MPRFILILLVTMTCLGLNGCYHLLSQIHIIEIQQGNVVDRAKLSTVKIGMSKQQVRNALGDPVLNNILSSKRWDYVYTMQKPWDAIYEKRATIYFDNYDRVTRTVYVPKHRI